SGQEPARKGGRPRGRVPLGDAGDHPRVRQREAARKRRGGTGERAARPILPNPRGGGRAGARGTRSGVVDGEAGGRSGQLQGRALVVARSGPGGVGAAPRGRPVALLEESGPP